jgi:hypothetical protein
MNQLIDSYVSRIIEDVNEEQLVDLAKMYMLAYYENAPCKEVISEIKEFYPDLLDHQPIPF